MADGGIRDRGDHVLHRQQPVVPRKKWEDTSLPEKPMLEQAMENSGQISERELRRQRELFVAKLQVMKTNYELSRKKNRDDSAS